MDQKTMFMIIGVIAIAFLVMNKDKYESKPKQGYKCSSCGGY